MSILQTRSPRLAARLVGPFLYPVGSIYISINSTNPGTSLGFGTWSAFGAGRVPVGFDGAQTEFDTDEEAGGSKTHTLSSAEMPAHVHTVPGQVLANTTTGGAANRYTTGSGTDISDTGSTGGGGAHNNLQPYIVVRMWKRTA